ncbi:hypothetical protein VKT23_011780 [Stygiomarasmius scandens]|uniref:Gustatory receptor n=1 Tax=Marasmiellus scandens TaxID=2682957 RepID=A0ABR1J8I1_9AGAR
MDSGVTRGIIAILFILGTEYLVHGMYTIVFLLSLIVLCRRRAKKQANNSVHLVSMVILFVLTTSVVILHSVQIVHIVILNNLNTNDVQFHDQDAVEQNLGLIVFILCLLVNFSSDLIIIYRMYLIWEKKKRIIAAPLIVSFANHVFGFCAVIITVPNLGQLETTRMKNKFEIIFFLVNLLMNLVVTFLNAWRIWNITSKVNGLRDSKMSGRISNAIAIIIESGLVYALALIILLITVLRLPNIPSTLLPVFSPILSSIPTLIIVRAGLGLTVENVEKTTTQTQSSSKFMHRNED